MLWVRSEVTRDEVCVMTRATHLLIVSGVSTNISQDILLSTFLPVASTAMPSTVMMAEETTGVATWPLWDTLRMMAAALSGRKMSPAPAQETHIEGMEWWRGCVWDY